ncbi:SDR family NAD(P)-dependent oxidoreductase [Streptomyces sp. NPDC051987]|uniref:SDR family NAD(P)-dependent oxidoreductase n=1 Tax=Streptomyces sp. NPDC051987 TaxID=3155808 RepID=UPI00343E4680
MTVERRTSDWLTRAVAELLHLPAGDIPTDLPFAALGLSSMQVLELSDRLQVWAGVELGPTAAYDHPDIDAISAHVAALSGAGTGAEAAEPTAPLRGAKAAEPVAVVGIGCRVPGAAGPEAFWTLLTDGVDAVGEVPSDRWDPTAFDDPGAAGPERVNARWGGFLADVAGFDSEFFGVASREAARMDPQQRLALEVAWESLEDAGIAPDRLSGSRTGVFMGVSSFDHGTAVFSSLEDAQPYDGTGGALSIVANRLSYVLDLRGPSLVVDTACSSSLVAVHLACQALRAGEAELALAGGVNVITSPRIALSFSQGGLMAADGRCKPFDHRADGYVRSEGVGVVVLKPLSAAVADRDRVYAVIQGSAVNQDGRTNGLTAPNGPSQEAVLRAAYRAAGVPTSDVGYVEAHGTGTAVGDPIEVAALAGVLGTGRPAARPLRIGSVKSNLGHLEAAAGVTGLIKTALALHHRRIPPTLHYRQANPLLGLDRVPVTVVADTTDWPLRADGTPAAAGVSSFGFGGTNSHLVLSAAPEAAPEAADASVADGAHTPPRLIPLSTRSADTLPRRAAAWAAQARSATGDPGWPARFGAAAAHRTEHAPYRAAVVAADAKEAAEALDALAAGERSAYAVPGRRTARHRPKVALVFPGQGSQWAGMGRRLALTVPVFRSAVREADAAIARHLGRSLWSDEHGLVAESTAEVQPALFAMQVALAETWRAWGLRPAAVIGHSMGEIAAARAAGALTLADAAAVVCERSRLLTEISGLGGLVLVELGEDEAAALITGRTHELSVAALNGPRATVLSGTPAALDEVVARLDAQGVFARRISVEFAAHSPQVEPLQPRLRAALAALTAQDCDVALYSTVTGEAVRGHELGPDYWVTNVRAPVRFGPALGRLLADGCDTFVEIAPHPVLARPVADHLDESGLTEALVVSSLRRDEDEPRSLLTALGTLYTAGVPVDWSALHPGPARHTPLPRHGWRHRHFPIARLGDGRRPTSARRTGGRLLGARVPVGTEPALRLWELPLGPQSAPELLDHVVEDVPLVAGAYWLTAAVQAAAQTAQGRPVALHEVSFAQPYPLLDEGRERPLQIAVRPGPDGREHFTVVSCPSDGRPVTHAEGVLGEAPGGTPLGPSGDLDEVRARCATEVPADGHYRRLEAAGLRYGPRFRGLERLAVGDGEALGRVRLPEGLDAGAPPLHPALLDSCLHTVAAATAGTGRQDALPLPVGADTVWSATEGTPLRTGWCHARILEAGHERIVADVTVLDDTGTRVWSATGLRIRLTAPRRRPEDGRLYEVRWTPYDTGPAAPDPGRWLLLADEASLGTAAGLAERLTRAGAHCATRRPGADSGFGDLTTAEEDGPLRGIVDTRAAAVRPGATAQDEADRTADALEPVRAVTGGRWRHAAPRLWLLTAGTQVPTGAAGDELPTGAGLWGLGRTVANEFPAPGCSLIDLDRDPAPRDLDAATAALLAAEPCTQVAVRAGELTAPVLREAARDPLAGTRALRADRVYVLTGGLGELGMRVARRLAGRGARHLLLIGRSAPSESAARQLAELRAGGCDIRVAQADVSDADSLRTALHGPHPDAGPARPPVGGVVHLAGVLADALLPDLAPRDLARAFAGKAVGAWHLHELTRDEPLEFFVLFSSLAGLIGSPGQGAYAAANSFLDALACRRTALGLPAHSIAWGTWAGASLAATGGGTDRLAARGVPPLDPGTGLELLDAALCGDRPQLAATALDPARLAAAGVWPSARELLAPLLTAWQDGLPGTAGARPGTVDAEILAAGSPAQRRQAMVDFLTDQVAQVLSARPGTVAADAPFHSMGLDSLMAIELRGRLESALGIRLSATLVYAHPTVGALADQVLSRLLPGDTPTTGERNASDGRGAALVPPGATAPGPDPDTGLAHLDDAEVAALLAAELDAFEAEGEE